MLKNRIAVITGAAQGIGLEIAKLFVANGATVIGLDYNHEDGVDDKIVFYKLDVSNTQECEKICSNIILKYNRVDILVNCAGITRDALTKKMSEEQFDSVVAVNLKGVWNTTRIIGPHMQNNNEDMYRRILFLYIHLQFLHGYLLVP